ncbi:MAG TPA: hypothetical protein PLD51_02110 [Pontiellaceae bacterium]|nr:hypothetical protein [Pontiellaceae bacterium]
MKRKLISILILITSILLMLVLLSTQGGCGCHAWQWGVPAFFTIQATEEFPMPPDRQMVFHIWNIIATFTVLCVPVFFAGYLWGKPNKKKSEPGNREVRETPAEKLTE